MAVRPWQLQRSHGLCSPVRRARLLACPGTPQHAAPYCSMQRLKTRPQFQATLNGGTVARTPHFALHRLVLEPVDDAQLLPPVDGPGGNVDAVAPSAVARLSAPAAVLIAPGAVWLGAMVPKRWARRAVTRNAIKRQIYGVAAAFEARLPAASHVVRLRATFDRKQFISASSDHLKAAVRQELHALFERASRGAAT